MGAAGSHTSSTRRVRHYWLADIDPPPAFLRHNHAVSWTAGDDTGRLLDPRAQSRGHGGAIDFGSHRPFRLGGHAIHVLKYLEKFVHPRWPMTFEVAKRAVGVMVLLLTVVLLLTPVPLSNVAPAMVISLISLAYVEEDGLLLSAAFLAGIVLIGIGSAAVWGTIVGAVLISA
jgi:hypothetical protein